MKSLGFGGVTLSSCMAAAMLAGCGGSQPPIGTSPPSGTPESLYRRALPNTSWIEPGASSQSLLYVSGDNGTVYVYTYPQRKAAGTLTIAHGAEGECVDSSGDVFITANATSSGTTSTIYEYAHGGTSPIATLNDPGLALGCSVDNTTGNLAVANGYDANNPYNKRYGSVAIYASAEGSATSYYSSDFGVLLDGYDNKGNLYLSVSTGQSFEADLARLARGASTLKLMKLDTSIYGGGDFQPFVQWDGKTMTVSSLPSSAKQSDKGVVSVYRLKIEGANASVIGTTELNSALNVHNGQSWIQGGRIIGIYNEKGWANVGFWSYPKGGPPTNAIKKVVHTGYYINGVVVSAGSGNGLQP